MLFELCSNAETKPMWPFEFRLKISFDVSGATLTQTAIVKNQSDDPMPFNIGFHPAFNWPLPGATAAQLIVRNRGDDPEMLRLEDGALSLEPHPSPFQKGRFQPTHAHFDDDAMVFLGGAGTGLWFGQEGGPKLRFGFNNLPVLGIWSAPNAPFLCI